LFFITNNLASKEHNVLSIPIKTQSDKNIIVRKVISEKCQRKTIERASKFSFEVYPNPTFSDGARITFKNSELQIAKVILTSYGSGESLTTYATSFTDGLLKFCNMKKGKYILTVFLESGDFYSKIIILE